MIVVASSTVAIVTALIAGISSLTVAIVTAILGQAYKRRNDERLAQLTGAQAERDAQRDYEYEARKRLYTDLQPVFFQLSELGESAFAHILGLARTAHNGHLGSGDPSWWRNDYFLRSTIHRLLVPLVLVRLCQRRMTFVDLSVDDTIATQYGLAKGILSSWNSGFDLAAAEPSIPYDPHSDPSPERAASQPATYRLQHLYAGEVERIADALVAPTGGTAHHVSYGKFEDDFDRQDSEIARCIGPAVALFEEFHPATSPVLWRMLLLQAHLYRAFSRTFKEPWGSVVAPVDVLSDEERARTDWREPSSTITLEDAVNAPLTAVRSYLIRYTERF